MIKEGGNHGQMISNKLHPLHNGHNNKSGQDAVNFVWITNGQML